MTLKDQFQIIVGAYYGIRLMDEYPLKEYMMKEIKEYMDNFKETHPSSMDYDVIELQYKDSSNDKTKLHDTLIILNRINAPLELILLVKAHIRKYQD